MLQLWSPRCIRCHSLSLSIAQQMIQLLSHRRNFHHRRVCVRLSDFYIIIVRLQPQSLRLTLRGLATLKVSLPRRLNNVLKSRPPYCFIVLRNCGLRFRSDAVLPQRPVGSLVWRCLIVGVRLLIVLTHSCAVLHNLILTCLVLLLIYHQSVHLMCLSMKLLKLDRFSGV